MKLRTYFFAYRKHTNNIGSKTVIRGKAKCSEFLSDKSQFIKKT